MDIGRMRRAALWNHGPTTLLELSSLLAFVAIWLSAVAWTTSRSGGKPLEFSRGRYLDLGALSAGVYTEEFSVTNRGSEWLTVDSIASTCGCSAASVDKEVLAPGRSLRVSVTITVLPEDRKAVHLFLAFKGATTMVDGVVIVFEGHSRTPLIPVTPALVFDNVLPGTRVRCSIACLSPGLFSDSTRARWTVQQAEDLTIVTESVSVVDTGTRFTIEVESRPLGPREVIDGVAALAVGVPVSGQCRVPISIRSRDDLSYSPRVIMGKVNRRTELPLHVGRIDVQAPKKWSVTGVESSRWLSTRLKSGEGESTVEVWVVQIPDTERALGTVSLGLLDPNGDRIEFRTDVAVEVEPP